MKYLFSRFVPGIAATLLIMALGAILSSRSTAQDARPSSAPSPAASGDVAQPTTYASEPSRDSSRTDTRQHSRHRQDFSCSSCGAQIDAAGRALSRRERDYELAGDREREPRPQVVYMVHVDGGSAYDLRAWPQSIFPMSTRWAMPIRERQVPQIYTASCR